MASFLESNFAAGQVLTAAELNAGLTFADYTPSWTQSVAITKTVNFARYTKFGKMVYGTLKMTASSAGTANNKILVGLPVSASANNYIIGSMTYYDDSGTSKYDWGTGFALYESSTTMSFNPRVFNGNVADADGDQRFGQNFTSAGSSVTGFTVAANDIIWVQFMYEAA